MKKVVVLLTLAVFALSIPVAMAIDVNRDALQKAWQGQQTEQQAVKKKADEIQANMSVKVEPTKPDTTKAKQP